MVKGKLSILLRFVVSFGLLILLIWVMRKDAVKVIGIIKTSHKDIILLAILINIFLSLVVAYRLKLLMSAQEILLSLKDAVYLTFIGYFFNNFLPTAIGGDIAKAYYASKKTNNKAASYAAVLADRILGLIATLLIALIGILFIGKSLDNKFILWAVPVLFLLVVIVIALLLKKNNRIEEAALEKKGVFHIIKYKILKLYMAINLYRNHPVLMIKGIVLSIFLQAGSIFSIYLFILSIGGNMAIFRLFLIIPLVWTVSMIPLSLNGLGVRESGFVILLKGFIGRDKAITISFLWLGLIMLYSFIGWILHLLYPVKILNKEVIND
jgi:uncharacterized protein (TIRG00374 family)